MVMMGGDPLKVWKKIHDYPEQLQEAVLDSKSTGLHENVV